MRASRRAIAEVVATVGVVLSRDHPDWIRTLQRMTAAGEVVAILPGVHVDPRRAGDVDLRILAASLWMPDAVVTGAAAARWTFWAQLPVPLVTLSGGRWQGSGASGFAVSRGTLPPEVVVEVGGVRVTHPGLTALDLGGPGIDRALLTRAASLETMHEMLRATAGRTGNSERRRLLHDSRDEPWSEAERLGHAVLRAAGITGWRANHPVQVFGECLFVDLGFPGLKVAIEIDGFEFHSSRAQFQRDRRRWSLLTSAGWRVIHVTYQQLRDEPEWFVAQVRATLRLAA